MYFLSLADQLTVRLHATTLSEHQVAGATNEEVSVENKMICVFVQFFSIFLIFV